MLPIAIGNDLVDLQDPHCINKHLNTRFLSKVCSEQEIAFIERSENAHVTLWSMWAIKEATYKALKKSLSQLTFVPVRFICNETFSECSWNGYTCVVDLQVNSNYVHALACTSGSKVLERVLKVVERVEPDEDPSQAVRKAAQVLLHNQGYPHAKITTNQSGIPKIILDGESSWDVTLSHDGRYVAAAVVSLT